MLPAWVCMSVRESFRHGDRGAVMSVVSSVAKDVWVDHRFVGDGQRDGTGEYYFLLKCSGWNRDIHSKILRTGAVDSIASVGDKPMFMVDKEVSNFVLSTLPIECVDINVGDVVESTEGAFGGLTGVVTKKRERDCDVFFRFHVGSAIVKVALSKVIRQYNVYEKLKVPVIG